MKVISLRALFSKTLVHLILIALIGLISYSNTFNSPFQWDEETFIVNNPIIKDLNYFLEPSKAKGFEFYSAFKSRYIGYLTFALNYKLNGIDVRGYHVFNVSIHILNALLVYFLVMLTFRTPFLRESQLKEKSCYIALFSALLFVSHPIQTEAVIYIFQRLASLCAFFYLLSLVLYISSRLSEGKAKRYSLYALSLLSAILAMKTKENAFTLPIVITLYEFFFFSGLLRKRLAGLIPFLLTMCIIPLTIAGIGGLEDMTLSTMGSMAEKMSSGVYLITELRVIVTYIRLLFLPINQNISYDYPVFHSFFVPEVFLSFLFLLFFFVLALYLFHSSRITHYGLRLIAFGVFWFFITISVESSIILIPMVINEYRVYLPSVGVFFATVTGIFLLFEKFSHRKINVFIALLPLLILPILISATYARNTIWKSRTSLWEDTAKKSPRNALMHYNLGTVYMKEGLDDKAIKHFQVALRLKPDYAAAHYNIGVTYEFKGLIDKAIEHLQSALRLKLDDEDVHFHLGVCYYYRGLIDRAIEHFQNTLKLEPDYPGAHYNIGMAYKAKGSLDKAIEYFHLALMIRFNDEKARFNLGVAYMGKKLFRAARSEFETVLQLNPTHSEARLLLNYISDLK